MQKISSGLDRLFAEPSRQKKIKGNVAYLCHNASVDRNCHEGLALIKTIFGSRLKAVFSPQHGLFSEAQDNMIESDHFRHPYFNVPVYSLYSETRTPTPAMLEGIDHVIVDLQDVGCRAYTFIYTMILLMEACGQKDIEVIVLDRPNPINGTTVEGNVLDNKFRSFIGLHPMPMRHGLTIGEIARMATMFWGVSCSLQIIRIQGWQRSMHFGETKLPWVFPSPNMPNIKTTHVFPSTVLLEGTNLSEGRGTTRPFEIFGHPALDPHACLSQFKKAFAQHELQGFTLRPLYFQPTFDKQAGQTCGGFQLHISNRRIFKPWRTGQVLLQELYHSLGNNFAWRTPPFEYEAVLQPIDILNGTDKLRHWVEAKGDSDSLQQIEQEHLAHFMAQRKDVLLYQ